MKVIVCFGKIRVVVPCKNPQMSVRDLQLKACTRYKSIIDQTTDYKVAIKYLAFASDGGIINEDDEVADVIEDKDKLIAIYDEEKEQNFQDSLHNFILAFEEIRCGSSTSRSDEKCSFEGGSSSSNRSSTRTPHFHHNNQQQQQQRQQSDSHHENLVQQQTSSSSNNNSKPMLTRNSLRKSTNYKTKVTTTAVVSNNVNQLNKQEQQQQLQQREYDDENDDDYGDGGQLAWYYRDSQEIILCNNGYSLGLTLNGYDCDGKFCGLLVESVNETDLTLAPSVFQVGDVIVEINYHILANYTYERSRELLEEGNFGEEVQLRVLPTPVPTGVVPHHYEDDHDDWNFTNDVTDEVDEDNIQINLDSIQQTAQKQQQELQQQEESERFQSEVVNKQPFNNISIYSRKIGNKILIQLIKDKDGLGFTITSRDTLVSNVSPVYIKNILSKGSAVKDGRLRIGDRILEVNGQLFSNLTQNERVKFLREIPVGAEVHILISRQNNFLPREMKVDEIENVGSSSSHLSSTLSSSATTTKENIVFNIPLNDTGSAGLGISVKGNQNRHTGKGRGIFIKSILHGGAVWQDGRLAVNDQLIEINSVNLIGLSNEQAITILKGTMLKTRGVIQVAVTRRTIATTAAAAETSTTSSNNNQATTPPYYSSYTSSSSSSEMISIDSNLSGNYHRNHPAFLPACYLLSCCLVII